MKYRPASNAFADRVASCSNDCDSCFSCSCSQAVHRIAGVRSDEAPPGARNERPEGLAGPARLLISRRWHRQSAIDTNRCIDPISRPDHLR